MYDYLAHPCDVRLERKDQYSFRPRKSLSCSSEAFKRRVNKNQDLGFESSRRNNSAVCYG